MNMRWIISLLIIVAPLTSVRADGKTEKLIETLKSDSSTFEKARACQQLGEIGNKDAVPALASFLNHDVLSAYARAGLERIPAPEASAALRDALKKTQGKLLVGVINSLAALRDEKAASALIKLTQNSDSQIVKASMLALGRISNEQTISVIYKALTAGPEKYRSEAAAACLLAAEQQLNQGNPEVAVSLYDTVRKANIPTSYRIGATRGAIIARTSDQVSFLIRQLRSDKSEIRDVALLTIREIPSEKLAAAINVELENAEGHLKIQLLTALKDCHNAQSLEVIKRKIKSKNPLVRLTALKVLASIGGTKDASSFLEVVKDQPGDEELSVATENLEQMQGSGINELILKTLRSSKEPKVKVRLIDLLSKRNANVATRELLKHAAGSDSKVKIAAFQALKSLAGFDELPKLIALTKTCRDNSVRNAAINAVYGACRNNEDIDKAGALVHKELKTSTVTKNKESWIRVLVLLGYADALPAITAALQDADRNLVQSTISHLSRWPDPTPIDALFTFVKTSSNQNLRRQALGGILRLATNAANRDQVSNEELVVFYKRAAKAVQTVQEKRLLLSGLARVKHIESVRLSATYLDDPDVKTEAVYAIVNAAEPLAKGPDYKALESVLNRISGVKDKRLLNRIANLKREIKSSANRLNK